VGFQETFNHIDEFVAQSMEQHNTPGIALAITDRSRTIHLRTYGYANLDSRLPIAPDHLFQIGSITKAFTAIAIVQLNETGQLDLHAPVTEYLPWFQVKSKYIPITPHHLLSHTAGIITGTHGLNPDAGLVMDVTFAKGPGVSNQQVMILNNGPTIGIGPTNHPGIHHMLVDTAKSIELPYQIEPTPTGSGTDAWAMEVVRSGIPTGLIGIPLRNMHMPVEIADVRDIDRTGRLIAEFITRLDEKFITEQLAWD